MQQRQLRLGDILDDYCPRERRLTNHAVVAMVGADVKQTRCTTCDAEHEYKHAKVPRQRKKADAAALQAPVVANAPKKVPHVVESAPEADAPPIAETAASEPEAAVAPADDSIRVDEGDVRDEPVGDEDAGEETDRDDDADAVEEGPVHRPLIRAQLPRSEGQPPATRPGPDFTIRQPGGRPNRFRPRHQRGGGGPFQGNRAGGNFAGGGGQMRGGGQRQGGGRPPMMSRNAKRQGGAGRKRSK
jgi:hypothetical protein